MYILLFHAIPVELSRRTHISYCFIDLAKMHSFLFPEDINGSPTRQRPQQSTTSPRRTTTQETTRAPPPRMPTRAPLTIPQQNFSAPPPPTYAPPPIPMLKEKPAISITELAILDQRQEPGLQRSKSKWSRREIINLSSFKERREAKARAAEAMPEIEVVLPPLSPVVNEEFWRTGRYSVATSPRGDGMGYLAF